jgi:predicted anti-sigma-YlaC factor YlaD
MDCTTARKLIEEQLDGAISGENAALLRDHVASCAPCAAEFDLAVALERVLSESGVVRAPARLDASVAREIVRRAESRRRAESMGIVGACIAGGAAAAFGVSRALNWSAAGAAIRGVGDAIDARLARLGEPLAGAPDVISSWSQDPAAVGVVLACAAAAAAFLAISGMRAARQFSVESH